jgi:hypothetical protein
MAFENASGLIDVGDANDRGEVSCGRLDAITILLDSLFGWLSSMEELFYSTLDESGNPVAKLISGVSELFDLVNLAKGQAAQLKTLAK